MQSGEPVDLQERVGVPSGFGQLLVGHVRGELVEFLACQRLKMAIHR